MLRQLLFRYQNKKQLLLAIIGAFIGFVFLLTSLHYFLKINALGNGSELFSSNLMVVQKKVSKFSTLGLNSNVFSASDIQDIKSLPFITKAAPIENNRFKISLGMRQEGLPYFRTDIFVQSVEADLLDVKDKAWTWKQSSTYVPLVMPRDFMVMLNQFAASYHIPQVSEDLARTITFRIDVDGQGKKEGFDAHIIGFSNQISAVLVPKEFMDYANTTYGDLNTPAVVSQLMITVKNGNFGALEKLIEDKNLELKKSEMTITKVKSLLATVISIILATGLLIILLSALVIFQYSQLLLSKSDHEISILLRLGYHPNELASKFFAYFIRLFGTLYLCSVAAFFGLKFMLDHLLETAGFPINTYPSLTALLILFFCSVAIVLCNYLLLRKMLVKKIKIVK